MPVYTNLGKTTSAKRNHERKSTLTWTYHRIWRRVVSKNHRTTAAQVTEELSIFLEDRVSTKLSDVSFTNPTFSAGL
jgi:hypothetical protein